MGKLKPDLLLFLALLTQLLLHTAAGSKNYIMGVNYGRVADNLPTPIHAVRLMQKLKVGSVKIYDADPAVLLALANTGLEVVVMVTNQQVATIGSSQAMADEWVLTNVFAWFPEVKITTVAVGNEILSDPTLNQTTWPLLVPAMERLHSSLRRYELSHHVHVTAAVAIDCLAASFPPSSGVFRSDIATTVMAPMLDFLNRTKSSFFVNVYPYLAWAGDPQQISLSYSLGVSKTAVVQDGGLGYTRLLDAQLDALLAAMARLGFAEMELVISETGWPTKSDANIVPGANTTNAAVYNNGLAKWAVARTGTPRRPGVAIPTFVFALFNEDLKPGPTTERNWGLLYPNGTSVYSVDLTGRCN